MRPWAACVRLPAMEFLPATRTPNPLPAFMRNRDFVGLALGAATAYTAKQAWDAHTAISSAPDAVSADAARKSRNTWGMIAGAGLVGTLYVFDRGSVGRAIRSRM